MTSNQNLSLGNEKNILVIFTKKNKNKEWGSILSILYVFKCAVMLLLWQSQVVCSVSYTFSSLNLICLQAQMT